MVILDTEKVYVANWFNKEHFELFLNRKLTDKEFIDIKSDLDESFLCDEVSELVRDYLSYHYK